MNNYKRIKNPYYSTLRRDIIIISPFNSTLINTKKSLR